MVGSSRPHIRAPFWVEHSREIHLTNRIYMDGHYKDVHTSTVGNEDEDYPLLLQRPTFPQDVNIRSHILFRYGVPVDRLEYCDRDEQGREIKQEMYVLL